jgi:hypothetical protein
MGLPLAIGYWVGSSHELFTRGSKAELVGLFVSKGARRGAYGQGHDAVHVLATLDRERPGLPHVPGTEGACPSNAKSAWPHSFWPGHHGVWSGLG